MPKSNSVRKKVKRPRSTGNKPKKHRGMAAQKELERRNGPAGVSAAFGVIEKRPNAMSGSLDRWRRRE